MKIIRKLCAVALAASLTASVGGCAGVLPGQRAELAPMISEDVVAFNQAYADAVNAMILQNVLRGRDRLPRYYTIMSGISDAPSRETSVGGGVGGIGIGNPDGEPWALGSLSGSYKLSTKPQYQITPYADDKLASALLSPIDAAIFQTFSSTGWRLDFLLEVLAEDIRMVENGKTLDTCAPPGQPGLDPRDGELQCRKDMIQRLAAQADKLEVRSARAVNYDVCRRVGALDASALNKAFFETVEKAKAVGMRYEVETPPGKPSDSITAKHVLYDCDAEPGAMYLGLGRDTYRVQLRSLDRTIYLLGETARFEPQPEEPRPGSINYVIPPGCERVTAHEGRCRKVPVFQIYEANEARNRGAFAARVRYGGQDYFAAPPVDVTKLADEPGDRTSSTLTLISQILVMMQTPASVKAPTRTFIEN